MLCPAVALCSGYRVSPESPRTREGILIKLRTSFPADFPRAVAFIHHAAAFSGARDQVAAIRVSEGNWRSFSQFGLLASGRGPGRRRGRFRRGGIRASGCSGCRAFCRWGGALFSGGFGGGVVACRFLLPGGLFRGRRFCLRRGFRAGVGRQIKPVFGFAHAVLDGGVDFAELPYDVDIVQ